MRERHQRQGELDCQIGIPDKLQWQFESDLRAARRASPVGHLAGSQWKGHVSNAVKGRAARMAHANVTARADLLHAQAFTMMALGLSA